MYNVPFCIPPLMSFKLHVLWVCVVEKTRASRTVYIYRQISKSMPASCLSQTQHIIAGGLGGLRRSFARCMVQRNAKYIILLFRSGPRIELHFSFLNGFLEQESTAR